MGVKDYDLNPDNNTQINGINIAEGCPPSGINNAIRQLMADVKADKDAQDKATVKTVNGNVPDAAGNITPEQTGCLPLTGGTMTGTLGFPVGFIVGRSTAELNEVAVSAEAGGSYGAILLLNNYYATDEANRGRIRLITVNGVSSYGPILDLFSNGTCTWNGSEVFLPAGAVFAFAGNIDVPGCLICNGASVSRSVYWRLFNAIGTTYGVGDGSTTFNLPNIEGRFIQGSDTAGTYLSAGLPDITGEYYNVGIEGANGNSSGAITRSNINDTRWSHSNTVYNDRGGFYFYASHSNSIYGASNTVQPPALTMRYYIKY